MKIGYRAASWITLILGWLLLSALTFFVIWSLRDRARLIRDRDNEQLLTALFTGMRSFDDFGASVEENPLLEGRIAGFALYGPDLEALFHWGNAPPRFDEGLLLKHTVSRTGRYTIPDMQGRSVKFVIQMERMAPPRRMAMREHHIPPGSEEISGSPPGPRKNSDFWSDLRGQGMFRVFSSGRYCYIDVYHPAYWRTIISTTILLPLLSCIFFALLWYIRGLFMRNREYRERIEGQKNLVVLGSAASTLAHEIKNPLLAIRIQTGILEKIYSGQGKDELRIINEEVDRLSALSFRINDYIRDPKGTPGAVNIYDILSDTAGRLLARENGGGSFIAPGSERHALVFADPERLRSVFENLIRNALESGGKSEEICAEITRDGNRVTAAISDRGCGIPGEILGRVFDPFFTCKSRGTGIGLSICRRFAEAAGGAVTLENRESGGALARLELPELQAGEE